MIVVSSDCTRGATVVVSPLRSDVRTVGVAYDSGGSAVTALLFGKTGPAETAVTLTVVAYDKTAEIGETTVRF